MAELANPPVDRRYGKRKKASVSVYVSSPENGIARYKTQNLSAYGLYIPTKDRLASPGTILKLVFAIRRGNLIRLHRRQATIAHITDKGVGLMLHHQGFHNVALDQMRG